MGYQLSIVKIIQGYPLSIVKIIHGLPIIQSKEEKVGQNSISWSKLTDFKRFTNAI